MIKHSDCSVSKFWVRNDEKMQCDVNSILEDFNHCRLSIVKKRNMILLSEKSDIKLMNEKKRYWF